ncbi:Arc family DNA-binding protein [Streptomyces lutosisoli]|uniref:Arc family DNA-binding protein n=1 Tax=Streptomyces lutosisoli TaxID=2665721 RepID=A0ABW2VCX7_9ACTN
MIRFSLRIPDDLHERVTARAAADRRSLNSEILHLLEVALAGPVAETGSPGSDPASPALPPLPEPGKKSPHLHKELDAPGLHREKGTPSEPNLPSLGITEKA